MIPHHKPDSIFKSDFENALKTSLEAAALEIIAQIRRIDEYRTTKDCFNQAVTAALGLDAHPAIYYSAEKLLDCLRPKDHPKVKAARLAYETLFPKGASETWYEQDRMQAKALASNGPG